ncbi:MAG: glucose-6-phosphate isomerase [Candidatus Saganbacteria bacterium]|nr:glucose-6-phosphate isomerase [Candidatus Saganbacteria bacterium]
MAGLAIPAGLIQRSGMKPQRQVRLDYRRFGRFNGQHVTEMPQFKIASQRIVELHELLMAGKDDMLKDKDVVMTGWKMDSPFIADTELEKIQKAAQKLAAEIEDFVSIGIGGSYLGIQATIDAVKGSLDLTNLLDRIGRGGTPRIFFLGHNMDPAYTARVLEIMKGRRAGGVVISKSGGTVEPAIAFAIFKNGMDASFSEKEVQERIIAVTDKAKGALKELAIAQGYSTYVVPDNVGGRYSVTCPVGLFALAISGVNIKEFIAGARAAENMVRSQPFDKNIAMLRAAMRFMAHRYMGKVTELASTGVYDLRSVSMWMQQLGPESEGKQGEGLLIVPQYYTREAHADGQLVQQGPRNLIETFLMVEQPETDVIIPGQGTPVEYLDGKGLHFANTAFVEGLRDAHYEGGVPTMSFLLSELNAFTIGMLYQFEMNAIALSGLLLDQNPFIQPGVQQYKNVANARSGKPGTEAALAQMQAAEGKLNPDFIV